MREEHPADDEAVAQRVLQILAEKASQHRALTNGQAPVPGLITSAMTAARVRYGRTSGTWPTTSTPSIEPSRFTSAVGFRPTNRRIVF